MIVYRPGPYHLYFIWSFHGSTIPRGMVYASCSTCLMFLVRFLRMSFLEEWALPSPILQNVAEFPSWDIVGVVLGLLLTFRTRVCYSRFWEGCTLVQQMRAEWYDAISTLIAFSHSAVLAKPTDQAVLDQVEEFQYTLSRLMSLMHGAALRQIGGDKQEFDVLDVMGLDSDTLEYLRHCETTDANRVEVLLHWIQELVTDNHRIGVLAVPPPILSRVYQTLSRGMVNLHNARKLADIPFPFPLAQIIGVLLLAHSVMHPIYVGALDLNYAWAAVYTFFPISMMWSITLVATQLEQPFGEDPNDLPLSLLQFDMNQSLLMLLDDRVQRIPCLKASAVRSVHELGACFGDKKSRTDFLSHNITKKRTSSRGPSRMAVFRNSQSDGSLSLGQTVESTPLGGPIGLAEHGGQDGQGGLAVSSMSKVGSRPVSRSSKQEPSAEPPVSLDSVDVSLGQAGPSLCRTVTFDEADGNGVEDDEDDGRQRALRHSSLLRGRSSDTPAMLRLPPGSQVDPKHLVAREPPRTAGSVSERRPPNPQRVAATGTPADRGLSRESHGYLDIKVVADMSRLPVAGGDADHVVHETTW